MFLQDNHAALRLLHVDGVSFEVWWLLETDLLILSHYPNNYPSTMISTLSPKDAIKGLKMLLNEGWKIEMHSDQFRKILLEMPNVKKIEKLL